VGGEEDWKGDGREEEWEGVCGKERKRKVTSLPGFNFAQHRKLRGRVGKLVTCSDTGRVRWT